MLCVFLFLFFLAMFLLAATILNCVPELSGAWYFALVMLLLNLELVEIGQY